MLQELVEQRGGLSPGRVMLERMWFHYQQAAAIQNDGAQANTPDGRKKVGEHLDAAHDAAKDVAPYVHTRLSSVVVSGDDDNPLRHQHVGLIGIATLTAADLANLDSSQLAQIYREEIAATEELEEEPPPDSAGT